jgi:hypothetical protein
MKLAAVKLYVVVVLSGLILLAGLVLLILQWGNRAAFSLYGRNTQPRTWLLVLASAVAGAVAWWLIKVLWRGAAGLRRLRRTGGASSA